MDDEDELKALCKAEWVWLDGGAVSDREAARFKWYWSDVDDDTIPEQLRRSRSEVETEWLERRTEQERTLIRRVRRLAADVSGEMQLPEELGLWAVVGHDHRGDGVTRSPNTLLGIGASKEEASELARFCDEETEVREYDPADFFSECEWAQVDWGRELSEGEQEHADEQGWDEDDIRRLFAHLKLMERLEGR